MGSNPRRARAAIGEVPQELNTDPFFTPLQSMEVQAGLYAVPKVELLARIDARTLLLRLSAPREAPPDLGPEAATRMREPDLPELTYPRSRANAPALAAAARAAGLEIADISTGGPKHEEVFLSLTARHAAE